jgi:hypothetical protein
MRWGLATAFVLAAAFAVASPSFAAPPVLTSVSHVNRHPAATWTLPPGVQSKVAEVATSPATSTDGYFFDENVKAFEVLQDTQTNWVYNSQLDPGTYYVHIAALDEPCFYAGLCPIREFSQISTLVIPAAPPPPPPPPPRQPRPDAVLTLSAGRDNQRLGRLEMRARRRSVNYGDAIRALGRASSCRVTGRGSAVARWKTLGVRMRLATLGLLPRGKTGCRAPRSIQISTVYITGTQWQTRNGLRVGAAARSVGDLYPRAISQPPRFRGWWPHPAWWIVHVRQRCVIGVCRSRYETVPRLTAHIRNGRVAGFFFPVYAQGE